MHSDMSDNFVVSTDLLAGKPCLWSNLGYWDISTYHPSIQDSDRTFSTYEIACQNLAQWVGDLSQIGRSYKILDLCVGRGGSVLYWLEHYAVKSVDAIELSLSSIMTLRSISPEGLGLTIAADIADPGLTKQIKQGDYDAVICLDAFYHLHDPAILWRLAAHALKPGGYLGFCSLLRQHDQRLPVFLKYFLAGARVQPSALLNLRALEQQLQEHGFTAPTVDWKTREVLEGFANFVERRKSTLTLTQRFSPSWLKITATAKLARTILSESSLGYAAVAALRR